jgi:hypothetical protein
MTTELSYTSTLVVTANPQTQVAAGICGAAITSGQAVWLDTSSSPSLLKPAKADSATGQTQAQNIVGIALDTTTGANQGLTYASAGDIFFGSAPFTAGTVYAVTDTTAGALAVASSLTSGSFVSVVGMAIDTRTFRIGLNPVAAKK